LLSKGVLIVFWIIAILFLGALVFFHELGHFIAAKLVGVRVLRFSLGFGARLVGFTVGETEYWISALPLGGYVKMAGDETDTESAEGESWEYFAKPWWARTIIALGGPAMNLVIGFAAAVLLYLLGPVVGDYHPALGSLPDVSVASQYGLREGDRVISLNGDPVESWNHMEELWDGVARRGEELTVAVARDNDTLRVSVPSGDAGTVLTELRPPDLPPVIGEVIHGTPAYEAGLLEGDSITAVAGVSIATWSDLVEIVSQSPDEALSFDVERADRAFSVIITPQMDIAEDTGRGRIGVFPREVLQYQVDVSLGVAILGGAQLTLNMTKQVYASLGLLVTRPNELRKSVAGPIGITQIMRSQAKKGPVYLVSMWAFISIALMVFNLLPIPLLDGGQVLLFVIEGITRRSPGTRTIAVIQRIGLAVVATIIVFAVVNDLFRVIKRERALREIDSISVEQAQHADETE
jgi:regulator of sigma E protease